MANNEVAFARTVKEELAKTDYSTSEKKYILSGFLRNGTTFTIGKVPSLTVHTEIASVAKLIYSSLKEVYSLDPKLRYETVTKFGKRLVYVVEVHDERLYDVMEDLEILSEGIYRIQPKDGLLLKNFRALLIGLFMSKGSINNPNSEKTSYFLEIAFTDKSDALAVRRKLLSFKEEKTMSFKYIKRRDKHVIYLKKSDQISVFLSYIGATESMFTFENIRIEKEEKNINNRFTICDMVNYSKTVQTAKRDIEDIETVLKYRSYEGFDEKTKAVMDYRREYDDTNYRELAEMITNEKKIPITKSGVVHILASIRKMAEDIRSREEELDTQA